jgi:hypothetical protein
MTNENARPKKSSKKKSSNLQDSKRVEVGMKNELRRLTDLLQGCTKMAKSDVGKGAQPRCSRCRSVTHLSTSTGYEEAMLKGNATLSRFPDCC